MEIGDELQLLRLDHSLAAALGFDGQLVAPQQRPRLREVGLSTGELRGEPLLIGHCRLHALPRGGMVPPTALPAAPRSARVRTTSACTASLPAPAAAI